LLGTIGFEKRGDKGFGYDPVFIIDDGRTLAEISTQEKTKISHRALAVNEFINYLNTLKLLS
jgi:XTP/dITP diphosphohydrolase